MGSLDQRRVDAARQLAARKPGESPREGGCIRHLSGALPAAQPAQLLVRRQPLDQHLRRRDAHHGFGHERTRQRRTIAWRPARQPTPHVHQRLDTRQFQRHDDPLVQICERPEFLPEPGEKIVFNVVPGS